MAIASCTISLDPILGEKEENPLKKM